MILVSKLIEELKKFPPDALAYAYEGEITGIIVVSAKSEDENLHKFSNSYRQGGYQRQLGHISASEDDSDYEGPAVIDGEG
jgi:hypothetical protein